MLIRNHNPNIYTSHIILDIYNLVPRQIRNEGTQPEFPFLNSGDPPSTPTDSKKKNFSFRLNLFKSEFVERTHLYSYVFH